MSLATIHRTLIDDATRKCRKRFKAMPKEIVQCSGVVFCTVLGARLRIRRFMVGGTRIRMIGRCPECGVLCLSRLIKSLAQLISLKKVFVPEWHQCIKEKNKNVV